jgi:hypothetical protein
MFVVIFSRPKCSSTKLVFVSVYKIIVIVLCRGLCFLYVIETIYKIVIVY